MNDVIKILCRRDGDTVEEATARLNEVRELIGKKIDYEEAEQIMHDMLGLEMDYIFDVIE